MNAHTPGKWHSTAVSKRSRNVGVYDEAGNEIALVKVNSALHGHRRKADARLIAAAPELLAALQAIADIEDQMVGYDWAEIGEAREIANAAIAKVTGETS